VLDKKTHPSSKSFLKGCEPLHYLVEHENTTVETSLFLALAEPACAQPNQNSESLLACAGQHRHLDGTYALCVNPNVCRPAHATFHFEGEKDDVNDYEDYDEE
jgi:hypothetical protein